MATIYDVARHAGVSAATVSRVLNGHVKVDPALAERVTAAVAQLGYRRNAVARNLRTSQTSLWAVIVSDIENPFFTSMVRGIEDVASSAGFSVVLCNSDENPEKESNYIAAALTEQMAGVVISPSSNHVDDVNLLLESECPVVVIDRELQGVDADTVLVDNAHGADLATTHLIEQGNTRIACIAGPRWLSTATQRLDGYAHALTQAGLAVDDDLIRYADFRERGGYDAMSSLLDEGAAPQAVFAANNLMTIGAMECLVQRGLAVPSDVAIVGFDSIPWADLIRPTLTTVAQPTYEVGRRAAQLLARRSSTPDGPAERVVLPTSLQVRGSSTR
ncbi:LacI family transcriptional regulator [Haloactinopolyspora alba]|uniref:LacI family transcriptional regulator n=1 Tax=Haloactinopolyspora alba TaxID=648780 RepID=A0A2P8E5C7_9ACTN|nr:LacI family DNA-binding transcriptional regulator [Haloactinopolyspora alba]PSL04678.1 LacI family transcriptional regulator [Haloactinopolyspora alba]